MFCCLKVHGIVNDTVAFVRTILSVEVNSATDNPVSFLPAEILFKKTSFERPVEILLD